MWRHQFMLASIGLLLVLPAVAWAAPPDDQSVISQPKNDLPRGMAPQESLSTFRVPPGFKVELAACEPLVKDPIALDWGADGKLWVVEMGDYPLGVDGKGKPGGVVRFLEDTNGDGRYDKATTFLDGLPFPTGVMPWRNGVLVAAAPDIFYAEDRDGDGKADHREVLFTGFGEGNQQHRLNGFDLGLDGWVYGANGDSGGTVRSLKTGKTVNIQGRDFRFRPDTGEFEAESGQTQYGRHRDDWGNWFGNNNPNWGWHYVLSEADLRRNPYYAPPDPRQPLEPDTRLYPISRTLARFNDPAAANHVTSANSPTPYRDDLFGPAVRHQPVRQRAGAQPGAPDGARAGRGDLSRRPGPGRGRPRVPRLERQLVPADAAQDRARRRPLGRRHVPRGHRAPRVDPGGRPEADRPPRRQPGGADLPGLSRRSPPAADPPARPARHGRAWSRPSTAPAAGSATRPSGCSCTGTTARPSSRCAASPEPRSGRRHGSRRSGRSRSWAAWTRRRRWRPWPTRIPRSAATRSRPARACSRLRPSSPRPCSGLPTIPTRVSGFSSPSRWATGMIPGWVRPWRGSSAATRATPGSARRCSARRCPTWRRCSSSCSAAEASHRRWPWSSRSSPWRGRVWTGRRSTV